MISTISYNIKAVACKSIRTIILHKVCSYSAKIAAFRICSVRKTAKGYIVYRQHLSALKKIMLDGEQKLTNAATYLCSGCY